MKGRSLLAPILAATAAMQLSHEVHAYPVRKVTVIGPYAPGSSAYTAATIISKKMSEILGVPFVIETRPGALGEIGVKEMLRQEADGYTICFCNDGSSLTVPAVYLSSDAVPPYSPKDFTAIGEAVEIYFTLIASKDAPFSTFKELVAYVENHPGELTVGSGSPTGTIITGLLRQLMGANAFVEVPYNAEPKAIADLLGGRIQLMGSTSFSAVPQIESKSVKAIGTVGWNRSPFLPGVQTLAEQAPEFGEFNELSGKLLAWNGFLGPKGMSRDVVDILSAALKIALADPEVVRALRSSKLVVRYGTPEGMAELFERVDLLSGIMKKAGVKIAK